MPTFFKDDLNADIIQFTPRIDPVLGRSSSPSNGGMWYDSVSNSFHGVVNGVISTIGGVGGGIPVCPGNPICGTAPLGLTVQPTADVVPLTSKCFSGGGHDCFDVVNAAGATTVSVTSAGDFLVGNVVSNHALLRAADGSYNCYQVDGITPCIPSFTGGKGTVAGAGTGLMGFSPNPDLLEHWYIDGKDLGAAPVSRNFVGTDTYTLDAPIGAYQQNQIFCGLIPNSNTLTTPSLNVNSLGTKTIVKNGGVALAAGDLVANHNYCFQYNGTTMDLIGSPTGVSFPLLAPNGTRAAPSYSFTARAAGFYIDANNRPVWADNAGPTDVFAITSTNFVVSSGISYSWSSANGVGGNNLTGGTFDTGLSRLAAGVVSVDTTSSGNAAGTLKATVYGALEAAPPSGVASQFLSFDDNTTHTPSFNANNNGTTSFTGSWSCTNVTPVTVSASVTTDQNLLACTIPAGTLNRVGRSLRIWTAGVYSTPAASAATINLKAKLCTVSGCGSGVVLIPLNITSGANPGSVASNALNLSGILTTQTGGASSAYEAHANLTIDLGALTTSADSIFADTNIGTVGNIDSTVQLFLQITGAFSAASSSNSITLRQLIGETIG